MKLKAFILIVILTGLLSDARSEDDRQPATATQPHGRPLDLTPLRTNSAKAPTLPLAGAAPEMRREAPKTRNQFEQRLNMKILGPIDGYMLTTDPAGVPDERLNPTR